MHSAVDSINCAYFPREHMMHFHCEIEADVVQGSYWTTASLHYMFDT